MALELDHRGQKGPDQSVLQPDVAKAARDIGLEADPALDQAIRFGRVFALGERPVGGFRCRKLAFQHVADLVAAFHGLDVPGEGNEIAPIAILLKQADRRVDVACL